MTEDLPDPEGACARCLEQLHAADEEWISEPSPRSRVRRVRIICRACVSQGDDVMAECDD